MLFTYAFKKTKGREIFMKILKRTLAVLVVLGMLCVGFGGFDMREARAKEIEWTASVVSEKESVETVLNPDCGFYKAIAYKLAGTEKLPAVFAAQALKNYSQSYGVLHFRFGLERYSSNAGGADGDISQADLTCLENIFASAREANVTVIARFSYNVSGEQSGGKYRNSEPSMELIKRHIAQLGEVLNKNLDVITSVETGMLGPWGEQHSTTLGNAMANESSGIAYELVNSWLAALDENRTVSVRRPLFYAFWANRAYPELGISINNIDSKIANLLEMGGDALRVGVFNDGYLGNASDLGTFVNREIEVGFLGTIAEHVPYGGEVVTDKSYSSNNPESALNDYNTVEYISKEGYETHTSYLNIDWNDVVIKAWKGTAVSGLKGADEIYNGLDGKKYVQNRLGYRLLLSGAETIAACGKGGVTGIRGKIKNVGFGNVINAKKATLILRSEDKSVVYSAEIELDLRKAKSGGELSYEHYFRLPASITSGFYDFYLQFTGAEEREGSVKRAIKFANEQAVFDSEIGGNYAGTVYVGNEEESNSEQFEEVDKSVFDDADVPPPSGGNEPTNPPAEKNSKGCRSILSAFLLLPAFALASLRKLR